MKSLRPIIEALFIAVLGVQTVYLWATRAEVRDLAQRLHSLPGARPGPGALSSHGQGADEASPQAAASGPVTRSEQDALARAVAFEQTRTQLTALATEELRAAQAREVAAEQRRVADQSEAGRRAAASQLGVSESELQRLEELGDALTLAEQKREGAAGGEAADRELARVSAETEQQLRQLLGEARYQKLGALRRDHPEYGRFLPVLRPPEAPSTVDAGANAGEPPAGPVARQ